MHGTAVISRVSYIFIRTYTARLFHHCLTGIVTVLQYMCWSISVGCLNSPGVLAARDTQIDFSPM